MPTITVFTNLLAAFAATFTPNLCDDVYLDVAGAPITDVTGRMLPRYCAWTGPDAPVWDADVCCSVDESGATCVPPHKNGRCRTGFKMYCEYGEQVRGGGVACYEPFPSMCDWGLCVEAPEFPTVPQPMTMACCSTGGVCQLVDASNHMGCQGHYLACTFGAQNEDGTIDCYN